MQANQQADSLSDQISEKLANVAPPSSESCIFKVHKQLRCINEKAYEPEIIAIGPYHHKKPNLLMMEEHKLRYLKELLQRKSKGNAGEYITALRSLELKARRCYAEPVTLKTDEFIEMLLLDGCFVIEVIRKFETYPGNNNEFDPIFEMDWMVIKLKRDLMLLENQLPFFVLSTLFDLIKVPNNDKSFMNLALGFFDGSFRGQGPSSDSNIKHLLGLIHNYWLPSQLNEKAKKDEEAGVKIEGSQQDEEAEVKIIFVRLLLRLSYWLLSFRKKAQEEKDFVRSATELQEAGVKFKKVERSVTEKGSLFYITFENKTILVPPLDIEDNTETFLRNLIVYEQYNRNIPRYITDYMSFMDCLIDSSKDVEILCQRDIFNNLLGDKEVVRNLFNKLGDEVIIPAGTDTIYANTITKINKHCRKRRYKWLAKLNRDYFNGPWAIISVVAAFVLLVLTSVQTYFTVFPR